MDAVQNTERDEWEMDAQLKARASAALVTADAAQRRARVLEKLLDESLENLSNTLKKCLDSHDDLRRRLTRLETANKGPNVAAQAASRYEFLYLEERYRALEIFVRESLDTLFVGRYCIDGQPNKGIENDASYILGRHSTLPSHLHYFQTTLGMYPQTHVSDKEGYPFPQKRESEMFKGIRYRGCEACLNIPDNNDKRNSAPVPATRHFVQSTSDVSKSASVECTEALNVVPATSPAPIRDPSLTIPSTMTPSPVPLQRSPTVPNHSRMNVEPSSSLEQAPLQEHTFSHLSFSFPKISQEEIAAVSPPPNKSSTAHTYVCADTINPAAESIEGSPTPRSIESPFPVIPLPPRNFPKPVNRTINEIGPKHAILPTKSQVSATTSLVGEYKYHIEPENSITMATLVKNIPYSSFPTNSQASRARSAAEEPNYIMGSGNGRPDDASWVETVEYLNIVPELDNETYPDAPPLPPRSTILSQSDDIPSATRPPDQVKNNAVKALLRAVPSLIVGSTPKKDRSIPKKGTTAEPKCVENDKMEIGEETGGPEAALLRATKLNDVKTCEELLAKHGSTLTTYRDLVGDTPVHWAAHAGHEEVLKTLVNGGAEVEARGAGGRTPLHYAAFQGRTSCIVVLLEAGADPELRTANGITPLHLTALRGHREAALKLLAGGADPRGKESAGRTAAQLATDKELRKVLERAEAGTWVPVAR